MTIPAGARLRAAVAEERPLQVVGAINAYCALLAERAGFRALYLSGAGVANASFGLPDLGITSLNDVCEDVRRITGATELPLLVDADTGWGAAFNIARTVARTDARRRRRHAPRGPGAGEALRPPAGQGARSAPTRWSIASRRRSMRGRRLASSIMARTDAHAVEGQRGGDRTRAQRYVAAGADMIFAEALTTLDEYRQFTAAVNVPVLANITEFGKTPLFTVAGARDARRRLVLYPLSAFRAMSQAARSGLRRHPHATARRRASSTRCRRALSCTTCSAITTTSASSMSCSARQVPRP